MRMLWDVLARIAAAAEARTGAGAARTQALLRGARKYLEEGHVTYLQNTIQANRAQVCYHASLVSLHSLSSFGGAGHVLSVGLPDHQRFRSSTFWARCQGETALCAGQPRGRSNAAEPDPGLSEGAGEGCRPAGL